jgi:hypothetical protein
MSRSLKRKRAVKERGYRYHVGAPYILHWYLFKLIDFVMYYTLTYFDVDCFLSINKKKSDFELAVLTLNLQWL